MNLRKDTDSDLKKGKFKRKKIKRVAADYLSNICLTGLPTNDVKQIHYDRLIANDFDCFLSFHKINASAQSQTDYFNYYKMNVQHLAGTTPRNFEYFINTEFNQFDISLDPESFYRVYIETLLARKKNSNRKSIPRSKPIAIPEIKIQPSLTFDEASEKSLADNKLKLSSSDNESEKKSVYNSKLNASGTLHPSQSSSIQKLPVAITSIIYSIPSSIKNKVRKAPNTAANPDYNHQDTGGDKHDQNEVNTKLMIIKETADDVGSQDYLSQSTGMYLHPKNFSKADRRARAMSESSDESNLSSSVNSNVVSIRNYKHHRPTLFNNLKRLTTERIILTSNNIPISVFSRLAFRSSAFKSDPNDSLKNTVPRASHNFISDVFDLFDLDFEEYIKKGEMSYELLIDPAMAQLKQKNLFKRANTYEESRLKEVQSEDEAMDEINAGKDDQTISKKEFFGSTLAYQPDFLDDPQLTELTAGKNRTCLKFSSYTVSIIDYVKPLELKKEINETFKEKFPYVQITLTKLRSIKREMLEIGVECMLDLIIVAQSYVYFERLILQGLINKVNRKYLAANSLLLAAKLNDVTKKDISKLLEVIITKFRFDNKREIISYEFGILVALEFNLMIKHGMDFISHYDRLVAK